MKEFTRFLSGKFGRPKAYMALTMRHCQNRKDCYNQTHFIQGYDKKNVLKAYNNMSTGVFAVDNIWYYSKRPDVKEN